MRRVVKGALAALPHHFDRRLAAYVGVVCAGLVGFWQVGPATDHRTCVTGNRSRSEIRLSFHEVLLEFGPQAIETDIRIQRRLAKALPIRDCSKVGTIFGHTFP